MKLPAVLGALIALIFLTVSSAAAAETVYRCGNEYSRVPCQAGTAIETAPAATPAQRAEAERVAIRERELGDRMERDRLRAERAHPPATAGSLGPAPAPKAAASASLKPKKKTKAKVHAVDGDDFVAKVPKAKAK